MYEKILICEKWNLLLRIYYEDLIRLLFQVNGIFSIEKDRVLATSDKPQFLE